MSSDSTPPDEWAFDGVDTARLDQIKAELARASQLILDLATQSTQMVELADPQHATLAQLAAAARSLGQQARWSSKAVVLLLTPPVGFASGQGGETAAERIRHAGEWAQLLERQLVLAVKLQALICSTLSDHVALAEEWSTGSEHRVPGLDARTLAEHARMFRRSVGG
jgi:hypothetical protein